MADEPRIIAVPTGSAEIRDQLLQDMMLAARDMGIADPPVEPGTDWYVLCEALSQQELVGLANISAAADDANVLTATGAALDKIREGLGLPIVEPTGASGKVKITVAGVTTINPGTILKLGNGLKFETVGTYVNPADGDEIDVQAMSTGAGTNATGGTLIQFVTPPTNVSKEAKVSTGEPLTEGTDAENDDRKRARILNTLQNKPGGGNWGELRQIVLDNFGGVQDCYVYPAPGGPGSQLIVPVRDFDIENNDFSRTTTSVTTTAVRDKLQEESNTGIDTVIRASADEEVDFTLKIDIPESALAGGNGQGWTDQVPWPQLESSDAGIVQIAVAGVGADLDQLTLTADTATAPVDGQTQIAWWSPDDRKFYTALVLSHSGSSGAWVVTLDRPLVGKDGGAPFDGDFISPNAQNLEAYGRDWVNLFRGLGPGKLTEDSDRIPRANRHPEVANEDPSSVTATFLTSFNAKHPEITDIEFGSAVQTSPTTPASVDDSPNVLIPRHFAVYPKSTIS
jgi:uncharacterized phage protein gp47/JayE